MDHGFLVRELPPALERLRELALDLRWTWSHAGDALWRALDPETWDRIQNPWVLLQIVGRDRLEAVAADPVFVRELDQISQARRAYLEGAGWYGETYRDAPLKRVAYFSMEFGLGEALPLYAGGLGVLAGDYLKTASDLAVPVVGIGLMYQEGYFRQVVDLEGGQHETYPYNDPTTLPVQPVLGRSGGWLHVPIELPGRWLLLRVWRIDVGRATLYLLDSNDPLNSPVDRGITAKLYGGNQEMRLMQEVVLGVGGWMALDAVGLEVDICHLNEGHAAFATLERARHFMNRHQVPFWEAWWATRAGNVFTTHTSVGVAFDSYGVDVVRTHWPMLQGYSERLGISVEELLGLGRKDPDDATEPFNMAYLSMRGCGVATGVSHLHETVSRQLFQPLFPRWPPSEVPVGHVTNGVHVPSWDSVWADRLWEAACGKGRWLQTVEPLGEAIQALTDEQLWALRGGQRRDLVEYVRKRQARQLGQRGAGPKAVAQAARMLDANVLTLGFAKRFTSYKRPLLLLEDPDRLVRILTNPQRPVQLVVAGKAHPDDEWGKHAVREWLRFLQQPVVRDRVVFLEDYDMALAQQLVQGVDVWINTSRRPWEACGTSGMKVLVNGGLNLSVRDGWWAEAYNPEVGWSFDEEGAGPAETSDGGDAERLYETLERAVVPEFYARDPKGIPRSWVSRIRASMARLTPIFSSNRMMGEYLEQIYLPSASLVHAREVEDASVAASLRFWELALLKEWGEIHFGRLDVEQRDRQWAFEVQVYLGDIGPDQVQVQLYAAPSGDAEPIRISMVAAEAIAGSVNGYLYRATGPATRPAEDFTPRVIPYHPGVRIPLESQLIVWQR
ncbi:MAG TPA: alpha-glucan family phosphorylase [Gemmatimonadales bacterium]|nr:alpha-glucan family phosphorylase [Gemmatimonadales bacterium]